MSINQYIGMGHITARPIVRQSQAGNTMATFTLALRTARNETLFLDCVCFKEQATYIDGTIKGALVAVEGRLVQDQWEDKNTGQKRNKIKCICHRVHFCRDAHCQGPPQSAEEEQAETERNADRAQDANNEKDIPF